MAKKVKTPIITEPKSFAGYNFIIPVQFTSRFDALVEAVSNPNSNSGSVMTMINDEFASYRLKREKF